MSDRAEALEEIRTAQGHPRRHERHTQERAQTQQRSGGDEEPSDTQTAAHRIRGTSRRAAVGGKRHHGPLGPGQQQRITQEDEPHHRCLRGHDSQHARQRYGQEQVSVPPPQAPAFRATGDSGPSAGGGHAPEQASDGAAREHVDRIMDPQVQPRERDCDDEEAEEQSPAN